jgi:hypothetical protein
MYPNRLYSYLALSLAVVSAFVVTVTFAFAHSTANDIGLGFAIGVTVLAAAACFVRRRRALRTLAIAIFLIGVWTIFVTAGAFDGASNAGSPSHPPSRSPGSASPRSLPMCTRARVQSCGPSRRGRPRDMHGRSDARYNNRGRETGPSGRPF